MSAIGHNGGPRLDDELKPSPPRGACCGECAHWKPPHARDQSEYEAFTRGAFRRVKEPSGACDQVLHNPTSRITAFSATKGRSFACFNFEKKVNPFAARPTGHGWTTIYDGERLAWQGPEGTEPAEYRQQELDL